MTVGNFASLPTTDPEGNAIKPGTIISNATDKQAYIYTTIGWRPFRCDINNYTRTEGSCGSISEVQCPIGYYRRADYTCGPVSEVQCPAGTYVRGDGSCGPLSEVKCPVGYYTRDDGSCGPISELKSAGFCYTVSGPSENSAGNPSCGGNYEIFREWAHQIVWGGNNRELWSSGVTCCNTPTPDVYVARAYNYCPGCAAGYAAVAQNGAGYSWGFSNACCYGFSSCDTVCKRQ